MDHVENNTYGTTQPETEITEPETLLDADTSGFEKSSDAPKPAEFLTRAKARARLSRWRDRLEHVVIGLDEVKTMPSKAHSSLEVVHALVCAALQRDYPDFDEDAAFKEKFALAQAGGLNRHASFALELVRDEINKVSSALKGISVLVTLDEKLPNAWANLSHTQLASKINSLTHAIIRRIPGYRD